ncbi:adhesin [Bifidobacterium imperatoris]|uniref:Adhesin n=1 Tax=Bifidobacterium imperatoris TaxID=2020965 RepID=A0A2N5IRK5_9BIFI|nr:adhesin [Bifidobacterium imperatoris]PLS24592.1 adhesin [Bifidobacterium imperatoris]QSY58521.1 adhesin [Bifidobacterium imperatoris]
MSSTSSFGKRRATSGDGSHNACQFAHMPLGKAAAAAAAISLVTGFGYGMAGTAIAGSLGWGSSSASSNATLQGQPGGGGADTMSYDYTGTYTGALTADGEEVTSDGETTSATDSDQNTALAQNGGVLTLTNATLNKSGDSDNADNNNFYGTNSVSLTVGEDSKTIISDSSINATSSGSNGIFSTDSGTVLANNVTINTSSDNSRALDATYGGTILASAITATTKGDHSATIATDRGGGSISATDSNLSTAGSGSPLLYSTGDVQVSNVTGTSSGSQIAGMEGLNTILIKDSTLTSTVTGKTASDPVANGVIIYQSTSGDAESTTGEHATFQAADSTLKSAIESGSMFYFTNTTADVVLSNTTLDFDSSKAALITAAGNDSNNWGSAGSNGATVVFTGRNQTLNGTVSADTISSVTLNLLDGSTWTGNASITENASATSSSTSDAPITVNVDGTSTWVVTDDTTVSALNVADGGSVVDSDGNTVTIVAGGKTVVKGTGSITVTVTGDYSTTLPDSATGDDTQLDSDLIDRSDFDSAFGTSTTWSM